MKKIYKISKNFKEAEKWDILQYIKMKPEERESISRKLIKLFYKGKLKDVKESRYFRCIRLNSQKT